MTDYISREVAFHEICKSIRLTYAEQNTLYDTLRKIATSDVAPVVHGHWVYKRRRSRGFRVRTGLLKNGERVKVLIDEREDTMEPFCSVCGVHNDSTIELNMSYCPHCNAKMDEEEKQ